MENLYVKFTVEVSNDEYSHSGQRGEAELRIQVPRSVLQHVSAPGLFYGILTAALVNFDTAIFREEVKEEKEETVQYTGRRPRKEQGD